jgi:hypothetical protein
MGLFADVHGGGLPGNFAVAVTSAELTPEESLRRYTYIRNPSTNTALVYLSLSTAAAEVGKGILLEPGDIYTIDTNNAYTGAIQCIGTAVATILIQTGR